MGAYFTDLLAWKEAIVLVEIIKPLAEGLRGLDAVRAGAQLISAAESIASNIAEGYGKGFSRDYSRYLKIAIASAGEVESRLLSAVAAGRVSRQGIDLALRQARRTRSLTQGLKRYVDAQVRKLELAQQA